MKRLLIPGAVVAVALIVGIAIAIASTGGGDKSPAAPASKTSGATVSVQNISGAGDVLVDAKGEALYANDQEKNGMALCDGACLSFWTPLTVSGAPKGDSLDGKLGVVKRPDGRRQVTYNGRLLYSFKLDKPGKVTGDGVMIYNAPTNSSDAVTINGSGPLRLSAPTSGIYKGITVFVDRTKDVPVNVQGNGSDTVISGTFYDAGGLISLSGNGGVTNMESQFICRAMTISGNGDINIEWNPQKLAQQRFIGLVE